MEKSGNYEWPIQFHLESNNDSTALYLYREMARYATLSFRERTPQKYSEWIKALSHKMLVRINHSACANYGMDQIAIADRFSSALYHICNYVLEGRDVLAVADTVSTTALDAMEGCRREICLIETDEQGMVVDNLAALCLEKKVGIVYLNSRGGYHSGRVLSRERIEQLVRLSKKYNLMIIEDDPHAGFHTKQANPLLRACYLMKLKLVYLTRLTFVDEHLHEVTIICGREKEIQPINLQLKRVGSILSPQLAFAINCIMVSNKLYAAEKAVLEDLDEVRPALLSILAHSGLWKESDGFHQNGWYLHLQPATGRLPFALKQQLADRNVHLVDTPETIRANDARHGLIISFAGYLSQVQLFGVFQRFHQHIRLLLK